MIVAVVAAVACALGCRGKPRSHDAPLVPATSASVPADRLAPGEPAPGQLKVHDLLLPRGATIDRRFGTSTYVHVPNSPEATANWIRSQAEDADGVVGPNRTVFSTVHVKGADRGHHLRIEISSGAWADSADMIIDYVDDTRPTLPKGLSNEEIMKKAGLSPDGKFLDPQHIE